MPFPSTVSIKMPAGPQHVHLLAFEQDKQLYSKQVYSKEIQFNGAICLNTVIEVIKGITGSGSDVIILGISPLGVMEI